MSATTVPDDLELLWTFEAGESIDSSAAIADGTVYVGAYTGELIALDLDTGEVRWRYRASEQMGIGESSPAVGDGRVFVGDLAGVLHAVGAATGDPLWTYATQGEIKSSPVLVGDRVLIGSYDGYLYGLDTATGELAWQVETQKLRPCNACRDRRGRVLRRLRRDVPWCPGVGRRRSGEPAGRRLYRRVGPPSATGAPTSGHSTTR